MQTYFPQPHILKKCTSVLLLLVFFSVLCVPFLTPTVYGVGIMTYTGIAGDGDWNNPVNWSSGSIPSIDDEVIITANIDNNSGDIPTIKTLTAERSSIINIPLIVTDGATLLDSTSVARGTITGDVDFENSSFNDGTIIGSAHFHDTSTNYGTVEGDAFFHDSNINYGTVDGNASFYNSSYNRPDTVVDALDDYGLVTGDAIFYDTSYNGGMVEGNATFEIFTSTDNIVLIDGVQGFS
jgi:hypothetical protein